MTNVQDISDFEKDDIECTNLNVNVNGLNFTALPEPLRNLLEFQAQTEDSDIGSIPLNKCILTNYEYFSPYF
jgi:hypothetical protein